MKKEIAAVLLGSIITAGLLAGCGERSATETANESAQTEKAGNGEGEESEAAQKDEKSDGQGDSASEEEAIPIGVLLKENISKDARIDEESFEKYFEEKNYRAMMYHADGDAEEQLKQFDELVDQGITTVVIDPVDPYSFGTAFEAANDRYASKLQLFSYNRLIMDTDLLSYYVAFDLRALGQQAAEHIIKAFSLEKADEGAEPVSIEFFMGSLDDADALFYYNGMMEKLSPYYESGILVTSSERMTFQDTGILKEDQESVKKRLTDTLAEYYPDEVPDILVTGFDGAVYAVQEVLEKQNIFPGTEEWPYITGFGCEADAVRDIAEGRVAFSIFRDHRNLVQKCVNLVDTCLKGESPEVDNYEQYDNGVKIIGTNLCDGQVIDADNYQLLIDNGYYTEAEVEPLEMVGIVMEEADETMDSEKTEVMDDPAALDNAEEKENVEIQENPETTESVEIQQDSMNLEASEETDVAETSTKTVIRRRSKK